MICTEQEAKAKWCPQARFVIGDDGANSSNRHESIAGDEDNPEYARCIGSACMMWAWVEGTIRIDGPAGEGAQVPVPPEERRGTCGLIPWSGF